MNGATVRSPRAGRWFICALLVVLVGGVDGVWAGPAGSVGEFKLMTYNLMRFSYEDRDQDGQRDNFKPEEQIAAVVSVIAHVNPDVLAVQEVGDADSFDILRRRLSDAGLVYPHTDYFILPHATIGLGLLSRFPIVRRMHITNETYTVGGETLPVQRGFLVVDLQANPQYTFRLINAHLKSKRFHPAGQSEMRRNEARLLNKHVRRMLDRNRNLNLVVVGDLNDGVQSSTLREVIGSPPYLSDTRPADALGDVWTHFWEFQETYSRIDYILVSAAMRPEWVAEKSYLPRVPGMLVGSDHRPVVAVFKAADQMPDGPESDNNAADRRGSGREQ
ncbi:MAG: endonuclease/exonuclease/phosphatase family protein [Kiritimatiellae bacterium]|nr:endonuclease/exonuclease/phosphatase family protein [Kiritimatiellia bacterium]MDW8457821.1 endonuclease/exonuclease/phosphatase family protein [Verrucomicrobiota bacterium]